MDCPSGRERQGVKAALAYLRLMLHDGPIAAGDPDNLHATGTLMDHGLTYEAIEAEVLG